MRSSWGTIRERQKGVWQLRYIVDGEEQSETVRGTRKQAEDRLASLRIQYAGFTEAASEITLGAFWRDYFLESTKDLAQSTQRGYRDTYACHIAPKFGSRIMSRVRLMDPPLIVRH